MNIQVKDVVSAGAGIELSGAGTGPSPLEIKATGLDTQGAAVADLGGIVVLTQIGATFADLAAARSAVNTLALETEDLLDTIASKLDELLGALRTAGIITT